MSHGSALFLSSRQIRSVHSRENDQPLLAISLLLVDIVNPLSGGYCVGVPPLPIPNREVKPDCADGTAMQCGRVGGRLLFWY